MRNATRLLKKLTRECLRRLVLLFGTTLIDDRTNRRLGKAIVLGWRGRILLIGLSLTGKEPAEPFFVPQKELRVWRQEISLRTPELPNYPHERDR